MDERKTIKIAEVANVQDAILGRPDGERIGVVVCNLIVHGHQSLELDFSGIESMSPSAASLMLHRIIMTSPKAFEKIVFTNVADSVKQTLSESFEGLPGPTKQAG